MSIIDEVNDTRDLEATLNRSLSVLVQLYTSAPHFIFELLQNAEDCNATNVLFRQRSDCLEFLHNGQPFTKRNLQGLTDVGLSDKLAENNQIGKFGVGFKSVFTICRDVYVVSDPSHWKKPGCYPKFTAKIVNFVKLEAAPEIPIPEGYTTAFVFPYATDKKFNGYRNITELRDTIAQKLQDIGALSLLFLSHIKTVGYDINIPSLQKSGKYELKVTTVKGASFTFVETLGDEKESKRDSEISFSRYLLFSRPCTSDPKRSVSIAFEVSSRKDAKTKKTLLTFLNSEASCISSYFPTGTLSGLNFIVQGPFVTTPNRSEILADDKVNDSLVGDVSLLLHDAILELCEHNLVTSEFINLLPFNNKVFKNLANPILAPLVDMIRRMIENEQILPKAEGGYISGKEACLARNNEIVRLINSDQLTKLIDDGENHGWLSTAIKQYCEYDELFSFLSKVVRVPVITPDALKPYFNKNTAFLKEKENSWITALYKLYSTLPNSFDERTPGTNMLTAAIIKTAADEFVPAYRDDGTGNFIFNVFRPISRVSKKDASSMVHPALYKENRKFFDEILKLPASGGYDVFVSEFVNRYSSNKPIADNVHISDVDALIRFISSPATKEDAMVLVKNHLKLYGKSGESRVFRNPIQGDFKFSLSSAEESLIAYYKGVSYPPCFVDEEFYSKHGIEVADLVKIGVCDDIVNGADITEGYNSKIGKWTTLGKFRYELMIDRLPDVLVAIQDNPHDEASRIKSKMIFNALMEHKASLKGKLRLDSSKASEELTAKALAFVLNEGRVQMSFMKEWRGAWLYTKDGVLSAPGEITKDDLDDTLYGSPDTDDAFYEALGLKYNERQVVAVKVREMPQSIKDAVFEEELLRRASDPASRKTIIKLCRSHGVSPMEFQISDDDTFPAVSVVDIERLRQHVLEQLAYADPVRFERRMRSVRISAIADRARQYIHSNYSLQSGKMACQMCHKFVPRTETVEIFANNDLELEPMHLCLCRNCSPDYRKMRADEDKIEKLITKILDIDDGVFHSSAPVEVRLSKMRLWFTPLHFAEIRLLLELMR